ncbi:AHNK protein, partial [Alopecoenas beccarii]|nr:AHNK protein [Alopecoenas beccarii]
GDQIVSATVYFDNLQCGEVAQLLNSMGHHTVGLRLQRKGDRSPVPGQTGGHDLFVPSSPEVVLSGDDEEYRRIYTTKIKPRLKSEDLAEPDGGGMQSRTITVTRKVTAYTVDVTTQDGCKDADVLGPEFRIRVPSREIAHGTKTETGGELETSPPQSQVPGGETGKSELPGRDVSGPTFPGSPAFEANGQTGNLEMGFHIKGPGLDGKGHIYGTDGQGEMLGGTTTRVPGVDVALENPAVDVGKIKIPVLKMPKFGFPGSGSGADAQAPCADVASSSVHLPGPQVSAPSAQVPKPQVDVGLKGDVKAPSPQLEVTGVAIKAPDVAIKAPDVATKAPGAAVPPPDADVHDEKIKLKIPHMTFPKFTASSAQGEGPGAEVALPKAEVAPAPCDVAVGVPGVTVQGGWEGPAFKKVETPQISLSDVNLNLKGPQVKGELGVAIPKMDVKVPAGEFEGPGGAGKGPLGVDVKVKGDVGVSVPKMDLKGPKVDVKGPKLGVDVPDVDIKGPKVTMPGVHVQTPQISMPDIDLNLKGPKVKGELDVSAPKLEGELKGPGLDIKGPKVDIEAPDMDVHGPEGKVKIPKLKMPKFGVPGLKAEGPDVDVTLPKGEVAISGPQVDVDVPSVDVEGDVKGPKIDVEVPDVNLECPEAKLKAPKVKLPHFNVSGPKFDGADVDVNLPKGEVDISGPEADIEVPELDVAGPEGKWKGPKFR